MADYVDAVSKAYRDLIVKCETEGIDWLQFDEPALVQDMGQDEIQFIPNYMMKFLLQKQVSCVIADLFWRCA